MDRKVLQVCMLGGFTLQVDEERVTDGDNRSRMMWLFLAYLLHNRGRTVSQEDLSALLWGSGGEKTSNPSNAMKTLFHRLRTMLEEIERRLGEPVVIRRANGYAWNEAVAVEVDVDRFEELVQRAAAAPEGEGRLEAEVTALDAYGGDYLPKLATHPWCLPINAYYHNLYLTVLMDVLPQFKDRPDGSGTVERLCRRGIEVEPYREELYQALMRALMDQGRQDDAIHIYEDMSRLLYDNFGVLPADETRALYREAARDSQDRSFEVHTLLEQLKEPGETQGALMCSYDFFQVLYRAEARMAPRRGTAVHICLLSVSGRDGKPLARRSLDRCMENLHDIVRVSLRKGDTAAMCSASQFVIMLPQANYENSNRVCQRIVKSFQRKYPHSPARLRYDIQPLEPDV